MYILCMFVYSGFFHSSIRNVLSKRKLSLSQDEWLNLKCLGEKILKYREQKGISQQKLADDVGVSKKTIGRIELGEIADPGLSVLLKIAKELDMNPLELIPETSYTIKERNDNDDARRLSYYMNLLTPNKRKKLYRLFFHQIDEEKKEMDESS